ncbi:MAG: PD40 domain-containing protein [Phycisphaerae bacterium]|nr:PD40 domain-containing protein [Phycisphaerae bacterium]
MFWSKKTILLVLALALALAAEVANADHTFGTPTNLGPMVNSSAWDRGPSITADGLELYFASSGDRGGSGGFDIWMTTRATTEDSWEKAVNLGPPINSSSAEVGACVSADGLELFFMFDERLGGEGEHDIWVATRETRNDLWSEPINLGPTVNHSGYDGISSISSDGLSLFFGSTRPGGYGGSDLWVTTRATRNDPWEEPVNLGPTVNSASDEACASISADGLTLFFSGNSWAPGPTEFGESDLWITRRRSVSEDWSTPENLGPTVNSSFKETMPLISSDGSVLFFTSDHQGGSGGIDLWQVSIDPVVDLNGDGIVGAADMYIMVDYLGTDEPVCDIGPIPWGDGIVDVQDLIVLAEHWSEPRDYNVIERRISASSDDAEEALNTGFTNWNYSSDLELVDDRIDNGGSQLVGMTFRDIDIAPGEVISNAYIEFVCDERINGTADAYFLIWGHLTPNSEGFVAPYVISNRPKTEAKVPWEPAPWDAGGQKIQTVNIAPIIQELIDQEGWVAGNAVEIIIGEDPSKLAFTGVRCAESYDGSTSNAPLLHIEIAVQ